MDDAQLPSSEKRERREKERERERERERLLGKQLGRAAAIS